MRDRKSYLGSADIAAIVGICQYSTPLDVYNAKVHGETVEEKESMKWGKIFESPVINEYCRMSSIAYWEEQVFATHPHYDFICGTADALTEDFVIEVKTTHAFNKGFSEQIPNNYFVQCQWLMGLHRRSVCHVPVLLGGQKLIKYTVDFNQTLYETLVQKAVAFWYEHIVPQVPPVSSEVLKEELTKSSPATDKQQELIRQIKDAKRRSDEAQSEMEIAKKLLFSDCLDVAALKVGDKTVATRSLRTRESWDEKKLLEKLTEDDLRSCKKSSEYYEIRIK